jgi:hypothetical protein
MSKWLNSIFTFVNNHDMSYIIIPLLTSHICISDSNANVVLQYFLFYKGFTTINNKINDIMNIVESNREFLKKNV